MHEVEIFYPFVKNYTEVDEYLLEGATKYEGSKSHSGLGMGSRDISFIFQEEDKALEFKRRALIALDEMFAKNFKKEYDYNAFMADESDG